MENYLVQLIKLLMVQRSGKAQLTGARTHLNWFAANKIQRKHKEKTAIQKRKHFFNLHHVFARKIALLQRAFFQGIFVSG